jgi:coenzyme F420-reducing hydrogenase beta subunit
LKLEQLRIAQLQQEKLLADTQSTGVVSKIKAYALPLAITGGLVVIGISAYFFFKNKK